MASVRGARRRDRTDPAERRRTGAGSPTDAAGGPTAPWAEAACLLAGALTPLAFHPLGTLGFEATKSVLVRLLALALVLGWLGRALADLPLVTASPSRVWLRDLLSRARGALRTAGAARAGPLAAIGYAVALTLATAVSVDPPISLLGSYERIQGLLTELAWITLGCAAFVAGRMAERRRVLVGTWLVASLPACLYALVQRFRLDPVDWLNQPLGATGTLGSSTALATYLAMLLPLTLTTALVAADDLRRRGGPARLPDLWHFSTWVALGVLQAAALVLTSVRGGIVALAAGLGVTLAALLWQARRRPSALAVLLGTVLLAAAVTLASGGPAVEDSSTHQRLLIWRTSLATMIDAGWRVLVGFGPETQVLALEPRFPVELAARYPDVRFDRAHNLLLDQFLTTGLLGLAAMLALLGALISSGWAALTTPDASTGRLAAGLLGALAAHLVAELFAFDSIATGLLFWLMAGLLVASAVPPTAENRAPDSIPVSSRAERGRGEDRVRAALVPAARMRATAMLLMLAVGVGLLPSLIGPLMADLYYTRALALRANEAPASSIGDGLAAVSWAPHQDVYYLALGETYQDVARTTSERESAVPTSFEDLFGGVPIGREGLFQAARLAFEEAVELSPSDPYSHVHLARFWALWGEVPRAPAQRNERLERSATEYDAAIARGPNRPTFYDEAGLVFLRLGRPDDAERRFREAEVLDGPTAERLARFGEAEVLRGNAGVARALYERALALDASTGPAEHGLALLDRAAGDLSGALEHAQRAARYEMRNWLYRRDLALIYRDLGLWDEALTEARAARRLAPVWEWDDLTELVESVRR